MPQRRPPFGPCVNRCQKPRVPCTTRRVSPAQVPPPEGISWLVGAFSVLQPELLAKREPYPPIWFTLIVVVVVPGIAVVVVVAGIPGVLTTAMLSYPAYAVRQPYSPPK